MQNDDEALLSINLANHGQLVEISLNFVYLYILRLYSIYQLKLNNNRQQKLCRSKQSDFFINPNKPYYITFYIGQSYKQVYLKWDKSIY